MACFDLLAYWQPRHESLDECSSRAHRYFIQLMECDSRFERWYRLGRSRKQALERRVDVSCVDELRMIFKRGQIRTDLGNQLIPDLGFRLSVWNGGDDPDSAGLSIHCGCTATYSQTPNNVILGFPEELGALEKTDRMKAIVAATVDLWSPSWAGVISDNALEARAFDASKPFVDWMIYLSKDWLTSVPALPPSASASACGEGTLIVVQEMPTDPADPAHVRNIRAVEAALKTVWRLPTGHAKKTSDDGNH